jgi:hypothetical protein
MTTKKQVIRADKSGHVELRCQCGSAELASLYNALDWVAPKLRAHSLLIECLQCKGRFSVHPECTGEDKCLWCRDLKGLEA